MEKGKVPELGHQRRQTYMLFLHAVTILSLYLNCTFMHVLSSFLTVEGDEGEGWRGLAFKLFQKQNPCSQKATLGLP